jgi:hypothetical protein
VGADRFPAALFLANRNYTQEKIMSTVTHDQVNLMLRLFELRREPRLREAREWFTANFQAKSLEEVMQKFPVGSKESTNIRMVVSYWDMCASIVNRGLIDDELYFESNGEAWLVWDRVREIVPGWRATFGNPTIFQNLEKLCSRLEAWREKVAPGSIAKSREIMKQMMQQMESRKQSAAS